MRLSASDVAPDFELLDADEQTFSSMLLRGQRAILYFYPAALTPGCTTQACDFRDNLEAFKGSKLTVVGSVLVVRLAGEVSVTVGNVKAAGINCDCGTG